MSTSSCRTSGAGASVSPSPRRACRRSMEERDEAQHDHRGDLCARRHGSGRRARAHHHLAVGAHQDDLEIMASDGILRCFQQRDRWFTGVVVTDGAGSPRDDLYKDYTDARMREVRRLEQKKAAFVGDYAAVILLDYPSSTIKSADDPRPRADIVEIAASRCGAEIVYTHNLADKHDTHSPSRCARSRRFATSPGGARPERLSGARSRRDLDWLDRRGMGRARPLPSARPAKTALRLGLRLGARSVAASGSTRAEAGRRRAAPPAYAAWHGTDVATALTYAMDLTPLVVNARLDPRPTSRASSTGSRPTSRAGRTTSPVRIAASRCPQPTGRRQRQSRRRPIDACRRGSQTAATPTPTPSTRLRLRAGVSLAKGQPAAGER